MPDHIVHHDFAANASCLDCGQPLGAAPHHDDFEARQVFDLPPITLEVSEHRAQGCCCPHCGKANTAAFPEAVSPPAQYGSRLQAAALSLRDYQLLPYRRLSKLFGDLFGAPLSEGTLANIVPRSSQKAEEVLGPIKQALIESPVAHADEWSGAT